MSILNSLELISEIFELVHSFLCCYIISTGMWQSDVTWKICNKYALVYQAHRGTDCLP